MARFQLASKRRYFLLAAATLVAAAALTASTFFTPLGLNQNNSLAKAADAKTALPAEIRIG